MCKTALLVLVGEYHRCLLGKVSVWWLHPDLVQLSITSIMKPSLPLQMSLNGKRVLTVCHLLWFLPVVGIWSLTCFMFCWPAIIVPYFAHMLSCVEVFDLTPGPETFHNHFIAIDYVNIEYPIKWHCGNDQEHTNTMITLTHTQEIHVEWNVLVWFGMKEVLFHCRLFRQLQRDLTLQ